MIIGNKKFENYSYVAAIINLTPDSFFAPSRKDEYTVLKACERAIKDGAAILDVGAQSTRPNYAEVSAEEEIARLEKPLELIKKNFGIPVSVDTYFTEVARAALMLGADMINDIWGLTRGGMAEVIAKYGAAACIMHNAENVPNGDIFPPVIEFLRKSAERALAAGIDGDKICLDGGIGFAKTVEQNFGLLHGYEKLSALGYPLLIGTSRKSFFGGKVEDRLAPTVESTRLAARKKVLFVRVHDVKENAQAIREEYDKG